jgi:hypothetical protein
MTQTQVSCFGVSAVTAQGNGIHDGQARRHLLQTVGMVTGADELMERLSSRTV